MYTLTKITILFTLVLALSLTVERFIEVFKAVLDMVDDRLKRHIFWTNCAKSLKKRLESKLGLFENVDPRKAAAILNRFEKMLLGAKDGYTSTLPVISGDMMRASCIKLVCKFVGIGIGIGMALWMHIDLIKIWQEAGCTKTDYKITSETLRFIVSGIAIGLGSTAVHKMINAIEKKREKIEGGEK